MGTAPATDPTDTAALWSDQPRVALGPLRGIAKGAGPTVLLLHGVGMRAEFWAPVQTALAQAGLRVLAPDLPGHGPKTGPITGPKRGEIQRAIPGEGQRPNQLPDHAPNAAPPHRVRPLPAANTMDGFCAPLLEMIPTPCLVVGHSLGALVALHMAATRPDRLRGVVALNAVYRRSAEAQAAVTARAKALDGKSAGEIVPTLERWFGTAPSPARDACARWLSHGDAAGYKAAYTLFARSDAPPDATLAQMALPARFVTGADEPNSTPAMSRALARAVPDGRAEIIPGARHMMPMTHPRAVTEAILHSARQVLT